MTALEYVKLRQGEKIGIAPVPVKPAPTTTTQTPVTEPPKPACPPAPTGNWSGSWWSDQGVGGSLSVGLQRTGNSLSGTLSISGSDLITGGQISGTVTCNKVRFGKVDKSIEFEGAIDADGAMVTGTYSASILKGGQRWPDSGTFTIRLR